MRQRAINIIKNVKVQLAYKTNSKEEEKPFQSDLEKPKKHKPISNNNPSFFYHNYVRGYSPYYNTIGLNKFEIIN